MNVIITTDATQLDRKVLWDFLSKTYWNKGITTEEIEICILNSLNFGMYFNEKQIGYARVVTDYFRFAYILDVFILEEYQRKNLGFQLMNFIFSYPKVKNIKKWKLATLDAQEFYKKFGFKNLEFPERMMEKNLEL